MATSVIGHLRLLFSANTAEVDTALKSVTDSAKRVSAELKTVGQQATAVGSALTKTITLPLLALAGSSVKAAMSFESSFANVAKTVDGVSDKSGKLTKTGEQLAQTFRDMAKEIPATTEELTAIAALGGQMGVPIDQLADFTKNVAALGVAVDGISTEEAASGLAAIGNATGEGTKNIAQMASALVHLGNNANATEGDILEFTKRLVGAGHAAGMTVPEVMAIGTAMANVGINAEAGGTAMSQVISKISVAVSQGGKDLEEFAKVALGTTGSAEKFAEIWKRSSSEALDLFIRGLGTAKASGVDLNLLMGELGTSGIRVADTLKRLSGATQSIADTTKLANEGYAAGNKHLEEAQKKYATTENQLKLLWNRIKDVGITLGNALLPGIVSATKGLSALLPFVDMLAKGFSAIPGPAQAIVVGLGLAVAAAGPLIYAFGQLVLSGKAVVDLFGKKGIATRLLAGDFGALEGASGTLGKSLGLLGKTAAVAGAAFVGWQIGRLIADLTGLDQKIADTLTHLRELQQARAQTGQGGEAGRAAVLAQLSQKERELEQAVRDGNRALASRLQSEIDAIKNDQTRLAMLDTLNRAIAAGADKNITYAQAVEFLAKKEAERQAGLKDQAAAQQAATRATETAVDKAARLKQAQDEIVKANAKYAQDLSGIKEALQLQILNMDKTGKSTKDLAAQYNISEETVKRFKTELESSTKAHEKAGKAADKHAEAIKKLNAELSGHEAIDEAKKLFASLPPLYELNEEKLRHVWAVLGEGLAAHARLGTKAPEAWRTTFVEVLKALNGYDKVKVGIEAATNATEDYAEQTKKGLADANQAFSDYYSNLTALDKKEADDRLDAQEDSLQKRLAMVKREHDAMRARIPDDPTHPERRQQQLDQIARMEEAAAKRATDAWQQHVNETRTALQPLGEAFATTFAGITDQVRTAAGALLGGQLFGDIAAKINNALTGKFGPAITATLGKAIPAIGATLGSLMSSVVDKLFGKGGLQEKAKAALDSLRAIVVQGVGSIGASLGGDLFGNLAKRLTGGLTSGIGKQLSGMLGSLIPSIGSALGSLIGPLADKLFGMFGNKGRKTIEEFVKGTFGTFENLRNQLNTLGPAAEPLWRLLTQGSGQNNPKQAQAAIEAFKTKLEELKQKQAEFNSHLSTTLQKVKDIGGTIPDAIRPYLEKLREGKQLTQENLDLLNALTGEGVVDWEKMKATAEKYGIAIGGLGDKFQSQRLHEGWQQIIDDADLLLRGGADVNAVLDGMKDEINQLVQESIKFGTDIPENMREWIQRLIDAGQLLDENGNKITDINKLKFGESLQTSLEKLVAEIKKLIDTLNQVPGAVARIPDVDVDVNVHENYVPDPNRPDVGGQNPDYNAAGGVVQPVYRAGGGIASSVTEGVLQPVYRATSGVLRPSVRARTPDDQAPGRVVSTVYRAAGGVIPPIAPPAAVAPVYRAVGGGAPPIVQWTPKGTDTVPAMLTPNEGVVSLKGMKRLEPEGLMAVNRGEPLPPRILAKLALPEVLKDLAKAAAIAAAFGLGGSAPAQAGVQHFAVGGVVRPAAPPAAGMSGDVRTALVAIERMVTLIKAAGKDLAADFSRVAAAGSTQASTVNLSTYRQQTDQLAAMMGVLSKTVDAVDQQLRKAGQSDFADELSKRVKTASKSLADMATQTEQSADVLDREFQGSLDGVQEAVEGVGDLSGALADVALPAQFPQDMSTATTKVEDSTTKVKDLSGALDEVELPPQFTADVEGAVRSVGDLAGTTESVVDEALGSVNSLRTGVQGVSVDAQDASSTVAGVGGAMTGAMQTATGSAEGLRVKLGDVKSGIIDVGIELETPPWQRWALIASGAIAQIIQQVDALLTKIAAAHEAILKLPPIPMPGSTTTSPTTPPPTSTTPGRLPPILHGPTTPPTTPPILGGGIYTGPAPYPLPRIYFAAGGRVPGAGTGDSVPAFLTPGELVLSAAMERNLSATILAGVRAAEAAMQNAVPGQLRAATPSATAQSIVFQEGAIVINNPILDTPERVKQLARAIPQEIRRDPDVAIHWQRAPLTGGV